MARWVSSGGIKNDTQLRYSYTSNEIKILFYVEVNNLEKNRWKYNFPTTDSETLMDCFVSFYNAHPGAKNIKLIQFGNKSIEISWE